MTALKATSAKNVWRGVGRRLGSRTGNPGPPPGERDAGYYDAGYYDRYVAATEGYDWPYYKSNYYALWAVIVDRVRRDGLHRVLEIGCGPGQLAAFLLDQGLKEYAGLDFSARSIDMAREAAPRGKFVVDDARSSSIYADVSYDAIICTEVLEHIEDDLQVIARFPEGARCLCTVPNFPYESHVRHFEDVLTLISQKSPTARFFLFDGVRNGVDPEQRPVHRPIQP